jgi:hypothetical protein
MSKKRMKPAMKRLTYVEAQPRLYDRETTPAAFAPTVPSFAKQARHTVVLGVVGVALALFNLVAVGYWVVIEFAY